jgi:hypothetical protein
LPLESGRRLSDKVELCDLHAPGIGHSETGRSLDVQTVPCPPAWIKSIASEPLRGEWAVREAALLIFSEPFPHQCFRLQNLSAREWRRLLHWLDISGLALYFLDRIVELKLTDWLPPHVLTRLQENLADNTERTRGMIAESVAIQQAFREAHLSYANLKGLSLWPGSVPKPELRLQFDLDFLVAAECIPEARSILERRGYRMHLMNGRSWEFRFNERPWLTLKDIYKHFQSYAVDLHGESSVPGIPSPLDRLEWRELRGLRMPSLSRVDLLLGQGLHAFKHISGGYSRAAHLLEFRRHVLNFRDDSAFWRRLQVEAKYRPQASLELGVVILLITRVMGDFAPQALTMWTVDRLPRPVQLWVEMFGHRIALGCYPGDKLHLLLQKQLEFTGTAQKCSLRQALLPLRLPAPAVQAPPNESLPAQIRRYFMYLQLIRERLRFHIVEGLRYAWESLRWRRQIDRFQS